MLHRYPTQSEICPEGASGWIRGMGEDRKFWSLITTIKAESTMILGGDGGDGFEHRRYLITQHKRLVLKYR